MNTNLGKEHNGLGYVPSLKIRIIRKLAKLMITVFGLNTNNRLSVELQQLLDPEIKVNIGNNQSVLFTTGHGRLLWRANTLFTEEELIIDWLNSFSKDDVFYDIGANVGMYSVYVSKIKDIKVYSFEPEINNIQLLYSNLYKNKLLNNCTIVPIAADNETKIKPFFIREFTKGGALNTIGRKTFYKSQNDNFFTNDTLCSKVDEIIDTYNFIKPTKMKIDVDTNELRVVEGLLKTLDYKQLTEIYIELDFEQEEHQKVIEILKQKNFQILDKEKIKLESEMHNCLFKRKYK